MLLPLHIYEMRKGQVQKEKRKDEYQESRKKKEEQKKKIDQGKKKEHEDVLSDQELGKYKPAISRKVAKAYSKCGTERKRLTTASGILSTINIEP